MDSIGSDRRILTSIDFLLLIEMALGKDFGRVWKLENIVGFYCTVDVGIVQSKKNRVKYDF